MTDDDAARADKLLALIIAVVDGENQQHYEAIAAMRRYVSDLRIKSKIGRSVDDIVEGGSDGVYYIAVILNDLSSALSIVDNEYSLSDSHLEKELRQRCLNLLAFVESLSLTLDGNLTLHRECGRCSSNGYTAGEDPCLECDGRGFTITKEDVAR